MYSLFVHSSLHSLTTNNLSGTVLPLETNFPKNKADSEANVEEA